MGGLFVPCLQDQIHHTTPLTATSSPVAMRSVNFTRSSPNKSMFLFDGLATSYQQLRLYASLVSEMTLPALERDIRTFTTPRRNQSST